MPLGGLEPRSCGSGQRVANITDAAERTRHLVGGWARALARAAEALWAVLFQHSARYGVDPGALVAELRTNPRRRGDLGRRLVDRPHHGRGREWYGSEFEDGTLTPSGPSRWDASTPRRPGKTR